MYIKKYITQIYCFFIAYITEKKGSVVVEFALITPIMLFIYVALVEFHAAFAIRRTVFYVGDSLAAVASTYTNASTINDLSELIQLGHHLMSPNVINSSFKLLIAALHRGELAADGVTCTNRGQAPQIRWVQYVEGSSTTAINSSSISISGVEWRANSDAPSVLKITSSNNPADIIKPCQDSIATHIIYRNSGMIARIAQQMRLPSLNIDFNYISCCSIARNNMVDFK